MQRICIICLIFFFNAWASCNANTLASLSIAGRIASDYKNYYSKKNIVPITTLFSVGATLANTSIDSKFDRFWQNDFRSHDSTNFFRVFQDFGESAFTHLPIFLLSLTYGAETNNETLINFGDLALRTWALGAPQQLILTNFTGGERPGIGARSKWKPFHGFRGISGHAFFGAIPFLAMREQTTNFWYRNLLLLGSVLPGVARLNNNYHFTSQVVLGYGIAYFTMQNIINNSYVKSSDNNFEYIIIPTKHNDGALIGVRIFF